MLSLELVFRKLTPGTLVTFNVATFEPACIVALGCSAAVALLLAGHVAIGIVPGGSCMIGGNPATCLGWRNAGTMSSRQIR
jgi:hypothetical protein